MKDKIVAYYYVIIFSLGAHLDAIFYQQWWLYVTIYSKFVRIQHKFSFSLSGIYLALFIFDYI